MNYENVILVKNIETNEINIPKPILKWVGGKSQIIDKLICEFPVVINNYHEIFLGGGSVLFALLAYVKNGMIKINGNIYAYDLNETLVYVYKNIQTNHDELYEKLQEIIKEYNSCNCNNTDVNRKPNNIKEATTSKENYYYWIRKKYNELISQSQNKRTTMCSAMFIFLNKTCFRGVYRVGPNGFNVPYGNYKNPEIINKKHLDEIHNLIQGVIFECSDFKNSLSPTNIEYGDYVYIDPPYAQEKNTSFVSYTENGFAIEDHNNLFNLIHKITETDKKIMLSNADVPFVREKFITQNTINQKYKITSILCKRSINSKNPEAKTTEVIIKNY
jgi:DNA adenine methylase